MYSLNASFTSFKRFKQRLFFPLILFPFFFRHGYSLNILKQVLQAKRIARHRRLDEGTREPHTGPQVFWHSITYYPSERAPYVPKTVRYKGLNMKILTSERM